MKHRHSYCIFAVACLVIVPTVSPASDKDDTASGVSLVGKRIVAKRIDVPVQVQTPDGQEHPAHGLIDAISAVEAEDGNRVRVTQIGMKTWLSKNDVVPLDRAIEYFTARIADNPKDAYGFATRAIVLEDRQAYDSAIADHGKAIELEPARAVYRFNRGHTYHLKKEYARASQDYGEAIRLEPKHAGAYSAFAWLLATCPDDKFRDGPKALQYANRAGDLANWRDGNYFDTLGVAYAEAGDFDAAIEAQKKALADESFAKKYGERARKRLELYSQHQAFHER
jgi:tetratricopeptide (TPR) repeat protein